MFTTHQLWSALLALSMVTSGVDASPVNIPNINNVGKLFPSTAAAAKSTPAAANAAAAAPIGPPTASGPGVQTFNLGNHEQANDAIVKFVQSVAAEAGSHAELEKLAATPGFQQKMQALAAAGPAPVASGPATANRP